MTSTSSAQTSPAPEPARSQRWHMDTVLHWQWYDQDVAKGKDDGAKSWLRSIAKLAAYYDPALLDWGNIPGRKPADSARQLTVQEQRVLDTLYGSPRLDVARIGRERDPDARSRMRSLADATWGFREDSAIIAVRAIGRGRVHAWCRAYTAAGRSEREAMLAGAGLEKCVAGNTEEWEGYWLQREESCNEVRARAERATAATLPGKKPDVERPRRAGAAAAKLKTATAARAAVSALQATQSAHFERADDMTKTLAASKERTVGAKEAALPTAFPAGMIRSYALPPVLLRGGVFTPSTRPDKRELDRAYPGYTAQGMVRCHGPQLDQAHALVLMCLVHLQSGKVSSDVVIAPRTFCVSIGWADAAHSVKRLRQCLTEMGKAGLAYEQGGAARSFCAKTIVKKFKHTEKRWTVRLDDGVADFFRAGLTWLDIETRILLGDGMAPWVWGFLCTHNGCVKKFNIGRLAKLAGLTCSRYEQKRVIREAADKLVEVGALKGYAIDDKNGDLIVDRSRQAQRPSTVAVDRRGCGRQSVIDPQQSVIDPANRPESRTGSGSAAR